jgi:hypothetical protein
MNNTNNKNKLKKIKKYKKLVLKLDYSKKQKNKFNFEYKFIKEKIDVFESINLLCLVELNKIRQHIYL